MSMDDRELIEELRLYVAVIAGEVTDLNVGLRMCANAMAQAADRLSTLSTDKGAIRAEAFDEAAKVAEREPGGKPIAWLLRKLSAERTKESAK